jgi:hypothetical protein
MSSFDTPHGLSIRTRAVDATFLSVQLPDAKRGMEGMSADSWIRVMQSPLATCENMRRFVGVTRRWLQQMLHGIWTVQGRY